MLFYLPGFDPCKNPSCRMHACDQGIFKKLLSLIVDHEGVSSGIYSKKIIQNLSLGNLKIFNKLPEDKSSLIRDIENNKERKSKQTQ